MGADLNRKTSILLVDDDEDLLLLMRISLKAEGFEVMISPNAANMSAMIANRNPDIIFLDIHMRGVDGGVICQDLKSNPKTADIPIVMFSGNNDVAAIADRCGADGFVAKPFNSAEVKNEVSRILEDNMGHLSSSN